MTDATEPDSSTPDRRVRVSLRQEHRRRAYLVGVLALFAIAASGPILGAASSSPEITTADAAAPDDNDLVGVYLYAPVVGPEVQAEIDAQATGAYIEAVAVRQYLDAVWVEQQAVAAYLWALAHPPRATSRAPTSVAGSGDCGPVAEVVGWGVVMRESTGQPWVVNGSDHRGCAQISGGWWGGACGHLDWTSINDQAECARIVLQLQGPSAWAQTWG